MFLLNYLLENLKKILFKMYEYRVGTRPLSSYEKSIFNRNNIGMDTFDLKHYCLLLDNDIFEYSPEYGYRRRIGDGQHSEFDWYEKNISGTTNVSPNELEEKIKEGNQKYYQFDFDVDGVEHYYYRDWTASKYDFKVHNCQHFVQFCLHCIGSSQSIDTYSCSSKWNKNGDRWSNRSNMRNNNLDGGGCITF